MICNHNHNFTFKIFNYKISFCVRCSSIVVSLIFWITLSFLYRPLVIWVVNLSFFQTINIGFLVSLPTVSTWLLQASGRFHNPNFLRVISSISLSFGFILVFYAQNMRFFVTFLALLWMLTVFSIGVLLKNKYQINYNCQSCNRLILHN
jgi:uncharacterized membrane protein